MLRIFSQTPAHQRRPRFAPWLGLATLLLAISLLAACSGNDEATDGDGSEIDAATVSQIEGERPIAISNLANNLSQFNSYRSELQFSWEAKAADGQTINGVLEVNETTLPGRSRMISYGGDNNAAVGLQHYRVGDHEFLLTGQGAAQNCVTTDQADESLLDVAFTSSQLLGTIDEASLIAKGETVNGIPSDHYQVKKFGERFGWAAANAEKNHIWLAQDGGYVVKYSGEVNGSNSLRQLGFSEGAMRWEYQLTEFNQVEAIDLPAGCQVAVAPEQLELPVPVPHNAIGKKIDGKFINFNSPDSVTEVATYYRSEMPTMGWGVAEGNIDPQRTQLSFQRDERVISLTITPAGNGSAVVIEDSKAS